MSKNFNDQAKELFDDNSHALEAILMDRMLYDLKTACAFSGHYLLTYTSSVDHDGFDMIVDDRDTQIKLQVKATAIESKTPNWKIHKSILLPSEKIAPKFGFELSPLGVGYGGGVILMEYSLEYPSIKVDYFYCDIFTLQAIAYGIVQRDGRIKSGVENKIIQLQNYQEKEFTLAKGCFFKAKSPGALVALLGLHGTMNLPWQNQLLDYIASKA